MTKTYVSMCLSKLFQMYKQNLHAIPTHLAPAFHLKGTPSLWGQPRSFSHTWTLAQSLGKHGQEVQGCARLGAAFKQWGARIGR